jgi:hypothetical protein
MAEATLERTSCENCGADVRANTQFCYKCGNKLTDAANEINRSDPASISGDARTALDDLAAKLRTDDGESGDKLAIAATKRKKARVVPTKEVATVWEADDTPSAQFIFIVSLLISLLVAAVVFVTVYWK